MDPLSALSVACAVVQFVDAGCTIVKKCKEVYVSAGGSTERNAELTAYAERLEVYLSSLKDPTSGKVPHGILTLERKCLVTAGKLQDAIRKTNVVLPAKGRQRFVRALFGTARSLWWEKDIAEIEKKLHEYRVELDEHILKEIYDNVQNTLPDVRQRLITLAADQRRMVEALLSGQKSVDGMMCSIDRLADQVQQLQSSLQHREEERVVQVRAEELRASLQFPNQSQRQIKIRKPGEGTFTWLLDLPTQSVSSSGDRPALKYPFVNWLTGDDHKLYWIWGKAGSGKSTLMKMLCMTEKPRVATLLQNWSAARPVLLPAYFFWRSGDYDQQKNIHGLLQTLLLRIVEGAHELTADLTGPSDEGWNVTSDGWQLEQLESALHRILARHDRPHICFFIDGLDEIEERPDELIGMVEAICRHDRVKVCVSSRPEFEFVEFFKTLSGVPHLRLEVINAVDIATFTDSRLHSIASQRDDLSMLAQEIKFNAQGVFIWVDYVIQYLETPIKQGESVEDVVQRLEHVPKKVEELYETMFKDMGGFELREAAMLFRLALLPDADIDVATCIVMLHQGKFSSPTFDFSAEFVKEQLKQFAQRLRSRCHGLLEPAARQAVNVTNDQIGSGQMIQFTHRTAATFATKALDSESGVFPPMPLERIYGQLCQATARLLYARTIAQTPVTARLRTSLRKPYINYDPGVTKILEVRESLLQRFFSWCRLAFPGNEDLVVQELDQLSRRIDYKNEEPPDAEDSFADSPMWAALRGTGTNSEHLCIFDFQCVWEDLVGPVSFKLDRLASDERREAYTHLLSMVVLLLRERWGKPYKRSYSTPLRKLETIQDLIRHGADVNAPCIYEIDGLYTDGAATTWQFFLTTLVDLDFLRIGSNDKDFQHAFQASLKSAVMAFLLSGAHVMEDIVARYILEEWNYMQRENGTWAIYIRMSATLSLCVLYALLGHDDSFWNRLSQLMPSDEPRPARVFSVERHADPARAIKQERTPLWQWHRPSADSAYEIDRAVGPVLDAKAALQKRRKPQTVTWIGGTQPYAEIEELTSFTNLLKRMQAQDQDQEWIESEEQSDCGVMRCKLHTTDDSDDDANIEEV